MTKVEEIKAAIDTLPKTQYARLRRWLMEKDWKQWDLQIEEDSAAGKLDFLIEEAIRKNKRLIRF